MTFDTKFLTFHSNENFYRFNALNCRYLFKIFSRTVIPIMWCDFEIMLFKSGSMFNIIISEKEMWKKNWKTFYFYFHDLVQNFCIWLHKSNSIMTIVAQVSDVTYLFKVCQKDIFNIQPKFESQSSNCKRDTELTIIPCYGVKFLNTF